MMKDYEKKLFDAMQECFGTGQVTEENFEQLTKDLSAVVIGRKMFGNTGNDPLSELNKALDNVHEKLG